MYSPARRPARAERTTRGKKEPIMEKTLAIIKPDAVKM